MRGSHSNEAPKIETPKSSLPSNLRMTESANGTEVYSSTIAKLSGSEDNMTALSCQAAVTPAVEEEDNLDVPVKPGTPCLRKGCGTVFVSNEASRMGDGPGTICTHHPLDVSPITSLSRHLHPYWERRSRFLEKEVRYV